MEIYGLCSEFNARDALMHGFELSQLPQHIWAIYLCVHAHGVNMLELHTAAWIFFIQLNTD